MPEKDKARNRVNEIVGGEEPMGIEEISMALEELEMVEATKRSEARKADKKAKVHEAIEVSETADAAKAALEARELDDNIVDESQWIESAGEDLFSNASPAELERFESMYEKLSNIPVEGIEEKLKEAELKSLEGITDEELIELIQKDKSADEALASKEQEEKEFIGEISVYDTVERESIPVDENGTAIVKEAEKKEADLPEKKRLQFLSRINSIPQKAYGITIAILLVLTAGIGGGSLIIFNRMQQPTEAAAPTPRYNALQPQFVSNGANYVFLGCVSELNGKDVTLQKMVSDRLATVFYFDNFFNPENYDFDLADDKGKSYAMDLSFTGSDAHGVEENKTVLRFEPLSLDARSFLLTVSDLFTESKAVFDLPVAGNIAPPAKYLSRALDFWKDIPGASGCLEGARFSTSGSVVNFSFSWLDDASPIQVGDASQGESMVSMKQGNSTVTPLKAFPNFYVFEDENTVLGRMDFAPVSSLSGAVNVKLTNLYRQYEVNQRISVGSLFRNTPEAEIEVPIGNYKIVLERMGVQKGVFLLVLHGEDAAVGDAAGSLENRVEVELDCRLVAEAFSGGEVMAEGKVQSSPIGSDILFDASLGQNILSAVPLNQYYLEIRKATIKMKDVTVPIVLERQDDNLSGPRAAALSRLVDSFRERLDYKSSKIPISSLTGFSASVLNDKRLMSNYAPVAIAGDAECSVQVVSYAYKEDTKKLLAVVSEVWKASDGSSEIRFYRTHKVVCDVTSPSDLIVLSDEIIS